MRWQNLALPAALVAAVTALVGTGATVAGASGSVVRRASEPYTGAQAALLGYEGSPNAYIGDCDPSADQGCVRFELRRKDRYFTLAINDATGLPVYGVVFGPDGSEIGEVCGETSKPLASPGGFVDVWLTFGSCYENVTPSIPTNGSVEATFARARSDL